MTSSIRQLRVFLGHASQDKSIVRELQQRLADEGWIDPWLDEKKIRPGEDWRVSIEEAVEASDSFVVCLSKNSVSKEGFVQKELRYAREIALEKPEGTIFLIPLRLDDCDVPRGLRFFQWTDYFGEKKEESYADLLESFSIRRQQIVRREREKVLWEKEEKEKREREEKAHKEAEELAKKEAKELARQKALELAMKEEEEQARKLALEKAEKDAFEKALEDAREKARLEAELYAQKEITEKKDKGKGIWNNFTPSSFLSVAALLFVGLVFGIGLVGLGQMGVGPFANTLLPTATATFTPTTTTLPSATSTSLPSPTSTPTIAPLTATPTSTPAPDCTPNLLSPKEGDVLDNGRTDKQDDIIWEFDWSDCAGATEYHLYVQQNGAQYPVIDKEGITSSNFDYISSASYIVDRNRFNWEWKVRAKINGQWGEWSETRSFDVEPLNTDAPPT